MNSLQSLAGDTLFDTFVIAYRIAIGQPSNNILQKIDFFETAFGIYYIVWTFITTVIFMNVLLVIINDSYT